MSRDPYYSTATWKRLRGAALRRDGGRCVVAGCGEPARVVDHIVPRRAGGADMLSNLRSLCPLHDNQGHREKRSRAGRREERFVVPGCDASGQPRDPSHWWNK